MSLRHPVFANTSQTCIHILYSTNLSRTHPLVYTCIYIHMYTYYTTCAEHIQVGHIHTNSHAYKHICIRTHKYSTNKHFTYKYLINKIFTYQHSTHKYVTHKYFTKISHTNILHTHISHTNISHTNIDVRTHHYIFLNTHSSWTAQICIHIFAHTNIYVLIFKYTHIATSREHIQVGQIRSSRFSAHISYNFRRTHSSRTYLHTHLHTDTYSRICIRAHEYLICTHSPYILT